MEKDVLNNCSMKMKKSSIALSIILNEKSNLIIKVKFQAMQLQWTAETLESSIRLSFQTRANHESPFEPTYSL